jgi:hypothetical protein
VWLAAGSAIAEVSAADKARYSEPVIQFTADLFRAARELQKSGDRGPREIVEDWTYYYERLLKIQTLALPAAIHAQFNNLKGALLEQISIMKSVPDDQLEDLLYLLQAYQKGEYGVSESKIDSDVRSRCARTEFEMMQAFNEIIEIGIAYGITSEELEARMAPP